MKSVLLTGATGLIGRAAVRPLLERGFTVYALKRPATTPAIADAAEVRWLDADLQDPAAVARACAAARATHLLHFAWRTSGDYRQANDNFSLLAASLELLRRFADNGGRRAVAAGTCFEYAFSAAPLREDAPLAPATPYAHCKCHLRELAELFCVANGLSFAWGRIFFVYGPGESPARLGGKLLANFRAGQPVTIPAAPLARDYVYTRDVGGAFAALLDGEVAGAVNVGSGAPVTLRDFALAFARPLGAEALLHEDPGVDVSGQPPLIAADVGRLRDEVGYACRYSLADAVRELVAGEPAF